VREHAIERARNDRPPWSRVVVFDFPRQSSGLGDVGSVHQWYGGFSWHLGTKTSSKTSQRS